MVKRNNTSGLARIQILGLTIEFTKQEEHKKSVITCRLECRLILCIMHDSLTNFHGMLEPIREIVAGGRVYTVINFKRSGLPFQWILKEALTSRTTGSARGSVP